MFMFKAKEGILNLQVGRLLALTVCWQSNSFACCRSLGASRMMLLLGFFNLEEPKEKLSMLLLQLELDARGAVLFHSVLAVLGEIENLSLCCFQLA